MEKIGESDGHKRYTEGLANGGVLGFIAGCMFGVGIITPGFRLCAVDTVQNKEITQKCTLETKYKAECNLPKITR